MALLPPFLKRLLPGASAHLEESTTLAASSYSHPLQAFGYAYAFQLLDMAANKGFLQTDGIRSVCDFGSGTGGPALAIRDFFKLSERQLNLLEEYPPQVALLRQFLPNARLYAGDGLAWLNSGCEKHDLMTAFMLGPDYDNDGLVSPFIHQALPRLSPAGKLLICSDVVTMHGVQRVLGRMPNVLSSWIVEKDKLDVLPITVIVSKSKIKTKLPFPGLVSLPIPLMKSAPVPDAQGNWAMERYCLSTQFERAYLAATIEAFEVEAPGHPAILPMKNLLQE